MMISVFGTGCVNITYSNNCCSVLIISLSKVYGYYFML